MFMMKKNRIENVHTAIPMVLEVSENKHEMVEQLSLSLGRKRKRVAFNLNVTTYEHVPVHEIIQSLLGCAANEDKETSTHSDDDDFVNYSDDDEDVNTSFLGHQVLNAPMESRTGSDCFNSVRMPVENILRWKAAKSKGASANFHSVRTPIENILQWKVAKSKGASANFSSVRTPVENILQWKAAKSKGASANFSSVRTPVENILQWKAAKSKGSAPSPCKKFKSSKDSDVCPSLKEFGWRSNARDRSDCVNSVRIPVENISQWKAAKSKGTSLLKSQKEQDKKVKWHSAPLG